VARSEVSACFFILRVVQPGIQAFSLSGRRALVTGGSRGLGLAFARALGQAGAEVAILARDGDANAAAVTALAADGIQACAVAADLTLRAELERALASVIGQLGGLDILVNNAGTVIHKPAFEVSDDEWAAVFDLNVRAMFSASVIAARHMLDHGGGSIINIGSMSGLIVNRPQHQAAYNASKAAVHHLTKSLAAEWAPYGIRVNAVAPGYVKTELAPVDRPELRRMWIEDAAQQRYALPEEIAPTVVYLASDASSFMTGSIILIDGGYTIY
jgi:NAD(P)-dependent dehydrogenase (short-subunit alcohol dehydrogenase family)